MRRSTLLQRTLSRLGFLRGHSPLAHKVWVGESRGQRKLVIEPLEARAMLASVTLSIGASSVNEGGTVYGAVYLDEPLEEPVYVSIATFNGTAQAPSDYHALNATLVLDPY